MKASNSRILNKIIPGNRSKENEQNQVPIYNEMMLKKRNKSKRNHRKGHMNTAVYVKFKSIFQILHLTKLHIKTIRSIST